MPSVSAISDSDTGVSPPWRASATMRRTPYSALVENIIELKPTCGVGYQSPGVGLATRRPIPAAPYLFVPMRKRLLLIGGGLVALAALVAGGGYIAYKAG